MYITGIRFRTVDDQTVKGWKFNPGSGKLRGVSVVTGDRGEMETIAHAVNFALSGKRSPGLLEVWLDAADDAGDIWTIERGQKGSNFRRNNKLLSLEEAQRSILASLLDLDASLNLSEGLVASVDMRQMITRGAEVAAMTWDPHSKSSRLDVASLQAARELAGEIAKSVGREEFQDPRKLARVAGPAARLLGGLDELTAQSQGILRPKGPASEEQNLESVHAELDLLNHIDQHLRRIHEGGDSLAKLTSTLETFDGKIAVIESRWSPESLRASADIHDPGQVIDQLIRTRAWGKFFEHLNRLKSVSDDQLTPISGQALKIWDEYLSGVRTNGQEIESCLASMLLGLKQMAHEVDRYVSQTAQMASAQSGEHKQSGWFERLKGAQPRIAESSSRSAQLGSQFQKDWVARLARDVESVKVATEYALQSSHSLADKMLESKNRGKSESAGFATLAQKAEREFERLQSEWRKVAESLAIDPAVTMEQLVALLRDGLEYRLISDARDDLKVRVEDRISIQRTLESLVRQWWEVNGSQKTTDLGNVSFLVVEAKAALRYREGRRQRIQKGLEDVSADLARKDIAAFIASRSGALERDWGKLLAMAELPVIEMTSPAARVFVDGSNRCAALLDMARVEEGERFAAASLWPSRLDSAVVTYLWPENRVPAPQRSSFLKNIVSFVGQGDIPVLLLLGDDELAQTLVRSGVGTAMPLSLDALASVEGPRREGAVVKSEMKSKRVSSPKATTASSESPAEIAKPSPEPRDSQSAMRARAEAALRILNSKPVK
jgi:hypothetical protein